MSHCLHAFICKKEELKVIPEKFIELPQGFVLFDSFPGCSYPGYTSFGDDDDDDDALTITEIANDICEINTDYFGGVGEQSAKLWLGGEKIKIDNDWTPIDSALKALGVVCDGEFDEFDTINLGRYRSNRELFKDDSVLDEYDAINLDDNTHRPHLDDEGTDIENLITEETLNNGSQIANNHLPKPNITMDYNTLETTIKPIIKKFIAETLNGRYKDYVSDTFIEAYIVQHFKDEYFGNPHNNISNIAYKSCINLFENLLEHGCGTGGNGHHVAQSLCKYFPADKSLEDLIFD